MFRFIFHGTKICIFKIYIFKKNNPFKLYSVKWCKKIQNNLNETKSLKIHVNYKCWWKICLKSFKVFRLWWKLTVETLPYSIWFLLARIRRHGEDWEKIPWFTILYFGHYSTNYFGHSKKSFNLILFLKDLNEATPKEPYQDIDFHLKSNVN